MNIFSHILDLHKNCYFGKFRKINPLSGTFIFIMIFNFFNRKHYYINTTRNTKKRKGEGGCPMTLETILVYVIICKSGS